MKPGLLGCTGGFLDMLLCCRRLDTWDERCWHLSRVEDQFMCWSRQMGERVSSPSMDNGAPPLVDLARFGPFLETVLGGAAAA